MFMDEFLDAICHPIPQLLACAELDFLRQHVFLLDLVCVPLAFGKADIAHAHVRAAHV